MVYMIGHFSDGNLEPLAKVPATYEEAEAVALYYALTQYVEDLDPNGVKFSSLQRPEIRAMCERWRNAILSENPAEINNCRMDSISAMLDDFGEEYVIIKIVDEWAPFGPSLVARAQAVVIP